MHSWWGTWLAGDLEQVFTRNALHTLHMERREDDHSRIER